MRTSIHCAFHFVSMSMITYHHAQSPLIYVSYFLLPFFWCFFFLMKTNLSFVQDQRPKTKDQRAKHDP